MRVAVIGAGVFGCTAAIHAARAGHDVHLYDALSGHLKAASGVNQFRLHAGYHYPRSPETVRECRAGLASFRKEYGAAVIDGGEHLYAIAAEGSRMSADDYLDFCDGQGLPYEKWQVGGLLKQTVAVAIEVSEARIDPWRLGVEIADKLDGVTLHFGVPATAGLRKQYDRIVIAAYAATNQVARALGCMERAYQFEVVEKPVVELDPELRDFSLVVLDGPFCSIDPFGQTGRHLMGHVEHAILSRNVGQDADISMDILPLLNSGIVNASPSRFEVMADALREFADLGTIRHIGSMFTVRAVLPDRDDTDERPTLVEPLDDQVLRVFSGKIGTCVEAAKQVCDMICDGDAVRCYGGRAGGSMSDYVMTS